MALPAASYKARLDALESIQAERRNRYTYDWSQADLDASQGRIALATKWNRARQQLPGQYMQRGLSNSGIYGQGLQQYSFDRKFDEQQLERQLEKYQGSLRQDMAMSEAEYLGQQSILETDLAATRTERAAMLR